MSIGHGQVSNSQGVLRAVSSGARVCSSGRTTVEEQFDRLNQALFEKEMRIRQLEEELGLRFRAPSFMRLTPSENIILGMLLKRPEARRTTILDELYPDRQEDHHHLSTIGVIVCTLRKKLRRYDVDVETLNTIGWRISNEGKARIRAMVARADHE